MGESTSATITGTSRWPGRARGLVANGKVVGLAGLVGAVAILVLRRPQAALIFEDGSVFYLRAWQDPLGSLVEPYARYWSLIPRLVAILERAMPYELAPLIGWLSSLLIVAGVALFVARSLPFSPWARAAMAIGVLLLTNADQALGSITFIQFYLAIFLVAAAIANGPFRWLLIALIATSLTGPFSILVLPLFVARAWILRDRDSALRLACVGIPALFQLALILTSSPDPSSGYVHPAPDLVTTIRIAAVHLDTAVAGATWTWFVVRLEPALWLGTAITSLLLILIVAVGRTVPRRALLVVGYVIAVVLVTTLWLGSDTAEQLLNPLSASRYFLVPTALLAAIAILSADRGHRVGIVLLGLLVFGAIADFRLPARPDLDWGHEAACIGGPTPCEVPIYPSERWTIRWPGR